MYSRIILHHRSKIEGAKTSRLQLCGFSLLSQISVIPITHARPIEIWQQPFLDRLQKNINPRSLQDRPPHLHRRVTRLVALHVVALHVGGELLG